LGESRTPPKEKQGTAAKGQAWGISTKSAHDRQPEVIAEIASPAEVQYSDIPNEVVLAPEKWL
jgi:hypothetical protein